MEWDDVIIFEVDFDECFLVVIVFVYFDVIELVFGEVEVMFCVEVGEIVCDVVVFGFE